MKRHFDRKRSNTDIVEEVIFGLNRLKNVISTCFKAQIGKICKISSNLYFLRKFSEKMTRKRLFEK